MLVAGLSAGGTAAAILGQVYPELFAAIGVHSGLACGAARDMPSALAPMQHGGAPSRRSTASGTRTVPGIVFHGERDGIVCPRNADHVVAQLAQDPRLRTLDRSGRSPGGYPYCRIVTLDAGERPVIEQWTIQGGGHAWSGGSRAGTFTDPPGPDATIEMVRFFDEHPYPRAGRLGTNTPVGRSAG